jgi:hypothetical protein
MLSVIILGVIMRGVIMLGVIMLGLTMLGVIMLGVIILCVIMLCVIVLGVICCVSLCWVSLCWVSLCWVSLCWVSWRLKKNNWKAMQQINLSGNIQVVDLNAKTLLENDVNEWNYYSNTWNSSKFQRMMCGSLMSDTQS